LHIDALYLNFGTSNQGYRALWPYEFGEVCKEAVTGWDLMEKTHYGCNSFFFQFVVACLYY